MNKIILSCLTALSMTVLPNLSYAEFPEQDVTIIVGYSAGGGTDITARVVAKYLEKYLGGKGSVVVQNIKGAGGIIGLSKVASSEPDGYTLGAFNVPASIGRMKDRKVPYDIESFEYLASVTSDPNTLITRKGSAISNLDELKKECASGKRLTLGVAGFGGEDHFAAKKIEEFLGCKFAYVPLGGDSSARTAAMGGHVDLAVVNVSAAYSFAEDLNFLGVMHKERSQYLKDVPTFRELGYDLEMASTRGYVVPKGTSKEIIEKLGTAFSAMFKDPEFLKDMSRDAVPVAYVDAQGWEEMVRQQNTAIDRLWKNDPWK